MKQKVKRFMGFLFSLMLVLVLTWGTSRMALAWDGDPYSRFVGTTDTVSFNGRTWYIIADNSTAVDAGTVTLFAADTTFDYSTFREDMTTNDYGESDVKKKLDDMTKTGGLFANVAEAILLNEEADGQLYLLSAKEAKPLSQDILKMNFDEGSGGAKEWWLRSPGADLVHADYVSGWLGEYYKGEGALVNEEYGVRPALILDLSKVNFSSTSNTHTFTLKGDHTHAFTFTADGATIIATCGVEGCDLNENQVTLTITAPTLTTYDGTGVAAATLDLNELEAFNSAIGNNVAEKNIMYVDRDGTTHEENTTAPTDAGKYTAKITVGEQTASVDYEIVKADPTAIAPTGLTATYGQTLADVSLEGKNPEGNTPGTWEWVDSTQSVGNVVTPAATFEANFTPTETTNYQSVEKVEVTVTVGKANPTVTKPTTAKTLTYTGSKQELVSAGSTDDGELYYAMTTENTAPTDESLYTTFIPTATDAGTYYVWYKVVGDENHLNLEPSYITTTIQEEKPVATVYTVTITSDCGGTGSVSPDSGEAGAKVILNAEADDGYQFKEWQVISGDVEVTDNQFTIGTANVEIKAVFEEIRSEDEEPGSEPGEGTGDNPGNEPSEQSGEEPGEGSGNNSGNEPNEQSGEEPGEGTADNSGNELSEQSGEESGEGIDNNQGDEQGMKPADDSGEEAGAEAGEEPSEVSGEEVKEKPSETSVEEVKEEPSEASAEEVDEKPDETPVETVNEIPDETSVEEVTKKPDETPVEAVKEEPNEVPVEEVVEQPNTDSGAMVTGWEQVDGTWYRFDDSGAMVTGWEQVDGTWYRFDESGAMVTGWEQVGDTWYRFDDSGAMVTGWEQVGDTWYRFDDSGAMVTGWEQVGDTWYRFDDSGAMVTGWKKIRGEWYLFEESGAMVTGWEQIRDEWYWFEESGTMVTGWIQIEDIWYYFHDSGEMAHSEWVDGCWLNADGAWE